MGSDRVPVFLALPNRNFLDLIEDCCHVLSDWRADACQISVLNERAGFQLFTCERSEGMLLSGPSIIAIMLAHRLIEPDNVSTLGLLADIATRPDLNDIIHRYVCKSEAQFVSNQSKRVVQTVDDVYLMVAECIQNDWRNLARELAIAEYDILHIQSYTEDYQSAASEMLNLFRHSEPERNHVQMQRLIDALKAIGRSSLSQRVSNSVVSNAIRC